MCDKENRDVENDPKVEGQFVDPVIATPIALFIIKEAGKAVISFITFKFLKEFWDRSCRERWNKWWNREEKDDSDID